MDSLRVMDAAKRFAQLGLFAPVQSRLPFLCWERPKPSNAVRRPSKKPQASIFCPLYLVASELPDTFPGTSSMKRLPFLLLVVLLSTSASARASETKEPPITEKDLFQFTWVADPQVSPDGSRVA